MIRKKPGAEGGWSGGGPTSRGPQGGSGPVSQGARDGRESVSQGSRIFGHRIRPHVLLLAGFCFILFLGSVSCGSTTQGERQPLSVQLDRATEEFFSDLAGKGTEAQSYFTLFLPQNTVNKRYLIRFRGALENALRRAAPQAGMHYNASADRVFFMSKHRPPGWKDPAGGAKSGEVLAREFKAGTPEGWTILHAFWSQYNRLLIGDDVWIQSLPESIRADLSHPLRYVVRTWVTLESNPDVTTYIHVLNLELVEVGRERTLSSERYPLILSYPLP